MGKIYTKKGDGGQTSTLRGKIKKSDILATALGNVDELNCWVGICRLEIPRNIRLEKELAQIQNNLLTIGSQIAGSKKKLEEKETQHLENLIDKLTEKMPKLTNFILPKGYLQIARAVARRGERTVVAAGVTEQNILKYMNRLSDALFVMARWVNYKKKIKEEIWK